MYWNSCRKRGVKDGDDESIKSKSPDIAAVAREFWKLDVWEDDARRRRRLVRNPLGSTHPEATLKVNLHFQVKSFWAIL